MDKNKRAQKKIEELAKSFGDACSGFIGEPVSPGVVEKITQRILDECPVVSLNKLRVTNVRNGKEHNSIEMTIEEQEDD